jgi:hypothetical protein
MAVIDSVAYKAGVAQCKIDLAGYTVLPDLLGYSSTSGMVQYANLLKQMVNSVCPASLTPSSDWTYGWLDTWIGLGGIFDQPTHTGKGGATINLTSGTGASATTVNTTDNGKVSPSTAIVTNPVISPIVESQVTITRIPSSNATVTNSVPVVKKTSYVKYIIIGVVGYFLLKTFKIIK